MYGTEKTKKAIGTVTGILEYVEKVTEDGKVSVTEIIGFIPKSIGLLKSIKDGKEIYNEYKDLDEAERQEVIAHFSSELDLANDKVEYIIEESFSVIVKLSELVGVLGLEGEV